MVRTACRCANPVGMSLMNAFATPCELAQRLPPLMASFMELELHLSRRFREDSLSDLFIASFLQLPGLPVAVLTPDETRIGSDLDLELVDPASGTTIRYRIQAKRLGRPTVNWKNRSYHHLAHPNETGGQTGVLCDLNNLAGAVPTIPLYAFFNHDSVCAASGVPGIALADAFEIEDLIVTSLGKTPKPLFKRISSVQHLFFDLATILCPPTPGTGRGIATPQESRDGFDAAIRARGDGVMAALKSRPAPDPGPAQPDQIRALRERERRPVRTAATKRPRIIVATSEPEEGD